MGNSDEKLTRLHLKAFGLSDYTIGKIVKDLNASGRQGALKTYVESDIVASVNKRLENSKIKPDNRTKLQRVLDLLAGETNVIPVDFLKELPFDKRLEVLISRIQELEVKEKIIHQQTSQLLSQGKTMATSK